MANPQTVLGELEELLEAIPDGALPTGSSPNLDLQEKSFVQATNRDGMATKHIIGAVSGLLSSRTVDTPFRVCSIGCGTGELDRAWLYKLKDQFPDLRVQYVGVDIDDRVCKVAEKMLEDLKFINVKTYAQDIIDGLQEEKFDLILFFGSFYYMKVPEKVLEICKSLLTPEGVMIIGLAEQRPLWELFARFWYRRFRYNICFPPKLRSVLETTKTSFSEYLESYSIDLKTCLQDRFSKSDQKFLLEVITQVDVFQYPSAIVDKCIDYLEMVYQEICEDKKMYELASRLKTHFQSNC